MDAMLSGRGWEVQERYSFAPVPAHHVRVRQTACYIVLAVLLNDQMIFPVALAWGGGCDMSPPPRGVNPNYIVLHCTEIYTA
uniref:Uncharacterized protein n=1 Tax=Chelydra serpentina TaxID=8475 RepID=A0A8C3S4B7_CHESE